MTLRQPAPAGSVRSSCKVQAPWRSLFFPEPPLRRTACRYRRACLLAWRQNRGAELSHQAAQLGQAMRHGEDLHAERVRHQAVLRTMSARLGAVRDQLAESDRRASALQRQLSTLRGNYESLRVELELQAALAEAAPVLELAGVADPPDPWVTARELWRISEAPAAKRPA